MLGRRLVERAPGAHEAWLRNEYFDHLDGRATERVLDEILARTGTVPASRRDGRHAPIARPRVTRLALEVGGGIPNLTVEIAAPVARASSTGRAHVSTASCARRDGVTTAVFPLLAERWGQPASHCRRASTGWHLDDGSSTAAARRRARHPTLTHELFRATVGGRRRRARRPDPRPARRRRARARLPSVGSSAPTVASRTPLEDAVFFESFYGQSASDNPLGIDRALAAARPQTTRYWSVVDGSVAVPDGGIRIVEGSREWWRARRTARVLVVNDWLRKRYRRRPGQHVLQTWHGTMLKRLALDRAGVGLRTRIAVRRERARWDALLSQNAYSTKIFRSAYAMRDPIWEEGYPRNDVLQLDPAALAARTARRSSRGGRAGRRARRALRPDLA